MIAPDAKPDFGRHALVFKDWKALGRFFDANRDVLLDAERLKDAIEGKVLLQQACRDMRSADRRLPPSHVPRFAARPLRPGGSAGSCQECNPWTACPRLFPSQPAQRASVSSPGRSPGDRHDLSFFLLRSNLRRRDRRRKARRGRLARARGADTLGLDQPRSKDHRFHLGSRLPLALGRAELASHRLRNQRFIHRKPEGALRRVVWSLMYCSRMLRKSSSSSGLMLASSCAASVSASGHSPRLSPGHRRIRNTAAL